jgi:hypothetical protein
MKLPSEVIEKGRGQEAAGSPDETSFIETAFFKN